MIKAELERRPLFLLFLGLVLGLTFARHPINFLFLVPAPWIVVALRPRCVLVAGVLIGSILSPGKPPQPIADNQFVDSEWTVASMPKLTAFGQRCEIESGAIRLVMSYPGQVALCPGAQIHVTGVAKPPQEGTDSYFESRGLVGRITPAKLELERDGPWIQRVGANWRNAFFDFVSQSMPPPQAASTAALTFNIDGLLDTSTKDEMQRTGTTHIVAASGLQVLVVGQAFFWLLARLPIPRSLQIGIVGCVLLLYAIATGLHPAVVRAVLMAIFANSAYLFRREPDWPSALALSCLVYLLWKPATVYDMGFQFSVVAVLFISLFADRGKWKPGWESWLNRSLRRSVRTALVAFAVVSPLLAFYFGSFSLIAIPANLLAVVAVTPVVVVSLAALPLSWIHPALGSAVMRSLTPVADYVDAVLHSFGGERAAIAVPPFSAYWLVAYYLLLLMLWKPYVRPA